jgi:aminoglycoside phosphotransferase family enzyme
MNTPRVSAERSGKPGLPSQGDIVAHLSLAGAYPERTDSVSVVETHHAWVFLTDRFAYKMKKPLRHGRSDFSLLESRRHLCDEEVRLNRRLAATTYLDVVPLCQVADGKLQLGGDGRVVEWLVKMRRLPRNSMLDVAASLGTVSGEDIDRLMRKLLRFYRVAPSCHVGSGTYTDRLRSELEDTNDELTQACNGFPVRLLREAVDRQRSYLDTNAALLERRQADGFVIESHGDLRPEHVCLVPGAEPEILDCLEFDPDLRCLDRVEELAYFGLECRVIGHPWIEDQCIDRYRSESDDPVPMHLWNFYAARRATVRAMLSGWHALDSDTPGHWLDRGRSYLSFAKDYLGAETLG